MCVCVCVCVCVQQRGLSIWQGILQALISKPSYLIEPLALMIQGAQFTCFTGTRVQILALEKVGITARGSDFCYMRVLFTCFTGTRVQILTLEKRRAGATSAICVSSFLLDICVYMCPHTDRAACAYDGKIWRSPANTLRVRIS